MAAVMNGQPAAAVHIVGGGLAGCEAAFTIARAGLSVCLHEMRPLQMSAAHISDRLAELVCSNSFRSDDHETNAVGQLHHELRMAGSLIMRAADASRVPAGSALAVDRTGFSRLVEEAIMAHPRIELHRGEVRDLEQMGQAPVIIATGPLTSPAFAAIIEEATGREGLAFFDAIAPIVEFDSIDMSKAWFQSRYDRSLAPGTGRDYINCPMTRAQYLDFVEAVRAAPKTAFHEWEKDTPFFQACQPIEVMAESGPHTLRHGPMKPRGLTDPRQQDVKPCAVVQLRQDNRLGTLYNMVGFQTKMTHGAQLEVFRTIPGLEAARFSRLGGMHRNSYIDSPRLLDAQLRLKSRPQLCFAGQICGCEGYVEAATTGFMAGLFVAAGMRGISLPVPPAQSACGALLHYITGGHRGDLGADDCRIADSASRNALPHDSAGGDAGQGAGAPEFQLRSFQPMNINFGLFPPLDASDQARWRAGAATADCAGQAARPDDGAARRSRPARKLDRRAQRNRALTARARHVFACWLEQAAQLDRGLASFSPVLPDALPGDAPAAGRARKNDSLPAPSRPA